MTSQNKLDFIEPFPFPDSVAKYLQPGVFPEIPGGSEISPAGPLLNAKYGKLTFTAWIWFTFGRVLCEQPSNGDESSIPGPDLVLDGFDPMLIRYASTKEQWYFQLTLATLNNIWCAAKWNYDIKLRTEKSIHAQDDPRNPKEKITRVDTLTDYHITIKIPNFWGYVRFKILDGKQNSYEQTSGCLKYEFKNFVFTATVTTKLIDKRFRTSKHKFRAPDIRISFTFGDVNHEILWYPFVGNVLPNDDHELNIPNLSADKIKNIITDIFDEKIVKSREDFIERYIRSTLTKLIPHVVEECRSKVDLVLTFATVLANGTEDDVYYLPPAASELIKIGVYSVTQKHLRDKILKNFFPSVKLSDDILETMEKLEADYQNGLATLSRI